MLDNTGFDLWADGYDESVGISEENNSYPFAGVVLIEKWLEKIIFQIQIT